MIEPASIGRFRAVQIEAAEGRLREKLVASGVDPERPAFLATWRVFKDFAGERVDAESDGLLFESGVYRFTGAEQFTVGFLRQFGVVDENGEHDYFVQLRCEFLYEPTDELRSLGKVTLWCFPSEGDSTADWCAQVERRPEFERAARLEPSAVSVSREMV